MEKKKRTAKGQKSLESEYRAFRRAMDENNHKTVVRYGLKLINRKDFDAPPIIYRTIGDAYLFLAIKIEETYITTEKGTRQRFSHPASKEDRKRIDENMKNAYRYLKIAYDKGAVKEPLEVARLTRAACYEAVYELVFLYPILKKCLEEIQAGVYKDVPVNTKHLLWSHFATCCSEMGNSVEAIDAMQNCYRYAEDMATKARDYGRLLFFTQYLPFNSEDLFEMHKIFNGIFKDITPYSHDLTALRDEIRRTGRKVRVGYMSPDCCAHVAMQFFIGLLDYANHDKFETFMYSLTQKPDYLTEDFKKNSDHFIDVTGMTYEEIAAKIHGDGIDILVDVAGHTANNALPVYAYKPAPIAMSGIGYLATTGLNAIDYYITDKIVDPPGWHEKYFTEKLLYLTSQFSLQFVTAGPVPLDDGAPCKKKGYVTFGSFNNYRKITDEMLLAWRAIMEQTPNSRLLLKTATYNYEGLLNVVKERFQNLGLDLSRIDFERAEYKYAHRYLDVDIALDTYPYTGGGTTCDALYMGVPVVSLYGERRNTRFSLGILTNVGLKYLAVDTLEKYIDMAVSLAKDTDLLDSLHRKIRPMILNSIVGSTDLYTKELEGKYLEVLGLAEEGQ